MHLKNFSLIKNKKNGNYQLSPCYDLLSTKILVPEDEEDVALALNGKRNKIKQIDWVQFAENIGLSERYAISTIKKYQRYLPKMIKLIKSSFLTSENQESLQRLMEEKLDRVKG